MIAPAAAALLLGLVFAATFAPLQHWWLGVLALAGLFARMLQQHSRGARPLAMALSTLAFGIGWFGAGLAWLYNSMHVYGGMPAPMVAAAVVVFAVYLAAFPAAASWLAFHWFGRGARWTLLVALVAGWTLAEVGRGTALSGFPWLAVGYGQLDGPLDRLAPLGGVYAVGAAAVALAALLAAAAWWRRVAPLALAVVLVVGSALVPRSGWTVAAGEPLAVRLVQGNVEQELKFRPERLLPTMRAYAEMIEAGSETLIVLPETAWTIPWSGTPEPIARRIVEHVGRGVAVSIGMPLQADGAASSGRGISNSVLTLLPGDGSGSEVRTHRYDKRHLVPFGEFIPLGFRWFVNLMDIPLGDFARGANRQPPLEIGGQRIAFNICYEDLFGEELIGALHGERPATILANVSNIAWFGDSHALPQHLQIARMRTLETGRPMLRSTNTGVTAAIDADGKVIARLAPYTTGALSVNVQGMTGLTPYARTGNWPIALAALACVAVAAVARLRGRGRQTR
jgi:apolipoprotein N-acyltransferase